jgi:hypothetical protein
VRRLIFFAPLGRTRKTQETKPKEEKKMVNGKHTNLSCERQKPTQGNIALDETEKLHKEEKNNDVSRSSVRGTDHTSSGGCGRANFK